MIDTFKGEHVFLSNACPIEGGIAYEGRTYPSLEHAFQAAKTLELDERSQFVDVTPAMAKKIGRKLELRPSWDFIRVDVMKALIHAKFAIPEFRQRLLGTGDAHLEETNLRHDNFWGVCRCPKCKGEKGINWFGKILMKERRAILAESALNESAASHSEATATNGAGHVDAGSEIVQALLEPVLV